MLEVGVLVEKVDGTRLSEKANEKAVSRYVLNVSMSEREQKSDSLVLTFSLELTQPQVARIQVNGAATLEGTQDEIREALKAPDEKSPPPALVKIYEKVYGMVYLLAATLKVPYPLPNLLARPT